MLKDSYVLERVVVNCNNIREGAWRNFADRSLHIKQICRTDSCGFDRLHWRHACINHTLELNGLVHIPCKSSHVGTERDFHSRLHALRKRLPLMADHLFVNRPAFRGAPFCNILGDNERRAPVYAILFCERNHLIIKSISMFDGVHAGFDGILDPIPADGMSSNVTMKFMSLIANRFRSEERR